MRRFATSFFASAFGAPAPPSISPCRSREVSPPPHEGIVHRDQAGKRVPGRRRPVEILDFGLAESETNAVVRTETGVVCRSTTNGTREKPILDCRDARSWFQQAGQENTISHGIMLSMAATRSRQLGQTNPVFVCTGR